MLKSKRARLSIGVILSLVVLFLLTYGYVSQPSIGRVTSNGYGARAKNLFDFTPVKVADKFISFTYPKSLYKVANNPQYPPQVDEFNYAYRDSQTWDLSISTVLVNYPISSNSGYRLRINDPSTYAEVTKTINNQPVYIFTDTTAPGFSKVAFLVNGQLQASVALTGDDFGVETNLQKTFDQVLNSWHWQVN
ncbi:MAG TPA: hypothetical protein VFN31_02715 [Candidatus Saccharimonadales bacterium]|nr:hypothetical protein [Candidatus Saccharimonadales bacterium]